jgi:hypothetical protein
MGMFKVIIKKTVPFQGRNEEFSNVYLLSTGSFEGFNDANAIDSIADLEKKVYGSPVLFTRGESYGINPVTGDVPRFGKALEGNGQVNGAAPYVECAVLVKFELPRKNNLIGIGRRRLLKKWLHVARMTATDIEANAETGAVPLGSVFATAIRTKYSEPMRNQEHGGGKLAAPNGDLPLSSEIHPFLEHHQFHAGKKHRHGLLS